MLYVLDEDLCYFGGEVKYLDWIDPDSLSLFEMDGYLVEFGFSESVRMMEEYRLKNGWAYYWRLPGERLKEGLQELRSDKDIMDMAAKVIQVSKFVEVYLINTEELTKANLEADKGENEIEVGRDILQSPLEVPHDMAEAFSHNNGTDGGIDGGSRGMNEAEYDLPCQNNVGEAEREGHSMEVEINIDDNVESDLERGLAADFEASDGNMEWQSSDGVGGNHDMYIDDVFEVPEEDEAYDSDYLGSVHSDEEDELQRVPTRPRYPEFNPEKDMNDPQFCLHQIFRDKDTFKDAVKKYSINSKQPLKFKHSDSKRVQVVCQPGCPWNIWVAPTNDGKAVQIRSCCLRHEGCVLVFKNTFGDANFIAKRYIQRFQADPDWGAASIMQTVAEDYNWTISRWKAWRTKRLAKDLIRGNAKTQYHKLQDYCAQVRRTSPGSTCYVETTENSNVFKRMYCCLEPCKKGAAFCRKVILLDRCFMKTKYGGQLLSAVSIDGNGGSFPLAYAAVKVENGDNWTWFLNQLCLDIFKDPGLWTFMSDKQKVMMFT
ncbi:unnamed protein product [Linum tenue]|uniref:Transposase MuDR plant domain-containing protein n=1 Tax=Linum tenue TaxID=586396 RepID=A0AAV0RQ80_9ROSI|nr:unnamed protein product [Linum tenue]